MPTTLQQVLTTARTYLNDDNANQFPDPALIPKVQEAHRELQGDLWVNGSPIVRSQTPVLSIPINASITNVNTLAPVGWPTDFIMASEVWESGSSPTTYTPVTEVYWFPTGYVAAATIVYWASQEDQLLLAPCTADRSIVVKYRRSIPIPAVLTDPIGILFGEMYLAPRAAAIAAGSVGNKVAHDEMTALAKQNFAKLLLANRGQQKALVSPGMGYAGFGVPSNQ